MQVGSVAFRRNPDSRQIPSASGIPFREFLPFWMIGIPLTRVSHMRPNPMDENIPIISAFKLWIQLNLKLIELTEGSKR